MATTLAKLITLTFATLITVGAALAIPITVIAILVTVPAAILAASFNIGDFGIGDIGIFR
jgi:hypothetical protein